MKPPPPIPFADALKATLDSASRHLTEVEQLAPARALGRIAAEAVDSPLALPPFANAAMDGYALRGDDLGQAAGRGLAIAGGQYAGPRTVAAVAPGTCVRITTGAPMPPGADTVVPQENVTLEGGPMRLLHPGEPGANVRAAGEDVAAGARIVDAGEPLGAGHIALLSAAGIARAAVHRRPTVAVFTTGDELREAGTPLAPGEIYDSNRALLRALLAGYGIEAVVFPALPDDPERIGIAVDDAIANFDLVIACGGASVGDRDLMPDLVTDRGRLLYWRVRMKPGMPVLLAEAGRALLFVLPGNPVSVFATFLALVLPALDAMQGLRAARAPLTARLTAAIDKRHGRYELRRGRVACSADGCLLVSAHPAEGSHRITGVAESNALIRLPADASRLEAGSRVEVDPYGAILPA